MTAIEKELRRRIHALAEEALLAEPVCAFAQELLANTAIGSDGKTVCFNCFEVLVSKDSDPGRPDATKECALCGAPVRL